MGNKSSNGNRERREREEREERERQERDAAQLFFMNQVRARQQREQEERERELQRQQRLRDEAERQRLAAIEAERQRLAKEKADRESNVDWLNAEIEKIRKQINGENTVIVREQKNIGTKDVLLKKDEFDLKKLIAALQQEKSKGSAYDQGDFEIQELTKKILECNTSITKHKSEYGESINIIQKSTNNLKNLAKNYDALFKDNSTEAKLLLNVDQLKQLKQKINKLKFDIDSVSKKINSDKKTVITLNAEITNLDNTISELNLIDYSNKVYNNENILKLKEKVDISLNSFFSYLKTKNNNPELTYGKIKYRELEHEKLNNFNKLLDLLFYCFYFVFITIIIFTGNIKREYFLIYVFIGLIPIIFPIVIKITKNINIRFDIFNGEKNAFIEDHAEYIDGYNI